jgi:DNA-binding GntR family transcriptional regulator
MILFRVGKTLEQRHGLVIEALRTRDVEAARETILAEVNQTRESILEHVIEEEGVFWRLDNRASE